VILIHAVEDEDFANLGKEVDEETELFVRPAFCGVAETHPFVVDVLCRLACCGKPGANLTGGFAEFGVGP